MTTTEEALFQDFLEGRGSLAQALARLPRHAVPERLDAWMSASLAGRARFEALRFQAPPALADRVLAFAALEEARRQSAPTDPPKQAELLTLAPRPLATKPRFAYSRYAMAASLLVAVAGLRVALLTETTVESAGVAIQAPAPAPAPALAPNLATRADDLNLADRAGLAEVLPKDAARVQQKVASDREAFAGKLQAPEKREAPAAAEVEVEVAAADVATTEATVQNETAANSSFAERQRLTRPEPPSSAAHSDAAESRAMAAPQAAAESPASPAATVPWLGPFSPCHPPPSGPDLNNPDAGETSGPAPARLRPFPGVPGRWLIVGPEPAQPVCIDDPAGLLLQDAESAGQERLVRWRWRDAEPQVELMPLP